MKKVELAYIAGIFDGEGSIGIRKQKGRYYQLAIALGMTNEYIPNLLMFSFGGTVYKDIRPDPCQVFWVWHIASRKANVFLEAILPYLKLKRNEAELAIKFQRAFCYNYTGGKLSDEQLAVREAQRILMSEMKIKK